MTRCSALKLIIFSVGACIVLLHFFVPSSVHVTELDQFHNAIVSGDLEKVKHLVHENPKLLNGRSTSFFGSNPFFGQSPLSVAAMAGQTKVVRYLMDEGADINSMGNRMSPLYVAARRGNTNMMAFLIDNGADVDLGGGKDSGAPLLAAAARGDLNVIELLIRRGCDINARDCFERTALMYAAYNNRSAVVLHLLKHGADPQLEATELTDSCTARSAALDRGHTGVVSVLDQWQGTRPDPHNNSTNNIPSNTETE